MSRYLVDRIAASENIRVLTQAQVREVFGNGKLERIRLYDGCSDSEREIDAAAVFVFIGAAPHTGLVAGFAERDEKGYVLTGPELLREGKRPPGWGQARDPFPFETSVPGVFAVGDVRSGSSKRVAAAVGEGSGAVGNVHAYLETV